MYIMPIARPFAVLASVVAVILLGACTLRVEKIKTPGINEHYFDFDPDIGSWQDSVFLMCCNGSISTGESSLDKGRYEVTLVAKGTQAYQVYPTLKVMLNRRLLQEVRLDSSFSTYRIPFSLEEKKDVSIRVRFDQDGLDKQGNDRNVFIRQVTVSPSGH